jgi:predicted dehydrogenase
MHTGQDGGTEEVPGQTCLGINHNINSIAGMVRMHFGLIGCGGVGLLRAAALKKIPSFHLELVCDSDEARAQEMSRQFGGTVESDWRALIHNDSLDAVIVSTPPHLHAEMCIEALRAHKHVLCEKPLARSPNECRDILSAARESGSFLATGFNYRFYPSIMKGREMLATGMIGELDHIRSYAGYTAEDLSQEWMHDQHIMGGGALRDNGIHLIDLTCYFLGEIESVNGFASNAVWNFEGCEDNGFALLRSKAGKIASLQASWTEWCGYQFKLEVYGSRGCIHIWCFPMKTEVYWKNDGQTRINKKTYFFPKTFIGEHLYSYRWVVTQSFVLELESFEEAIKGKDTNIATGHDGLRSVEIAHDASRNSKSALLS